MFLRTLADSKGRFLLCDAVVTEQPRTPLPYRELADSALLWQRWPLTRPDQPFLPGSKGRLVVTPR